MGPISPADTAMALWKLLGSHWGRGRWAISMKGLETGMDETYSWKRKEEIGIDVPDLLYCLCRQWKRMIVCALASAVLLGAYGWIKGRNKPSAAMYGMEDEIELTDAEEQGVADAVRLESEIRGLETYLDNSILMQIDPYHKAKYIMLYGIDSAQRQELPRITESYLNFVSNGGAADALGESGKSWKMDKSYLAELITAYQKTYSSPYQIAIDAAGDHSILSESLFYVEVAGKNAKDAEKIALDMQGILEEYFAVVKKTAGNHRLTLLNSMESIVADSGLQSQQHDKKMLLSSNRTNRKTMTDAFSQEQMAVYQAAVGLEEGQERTEEGLEAAASDTGGFRVKYILFGFVGGIFVYCCIFLGWYVLCDTVKSLDEMDALYTFPVYGGILLEDSALKKGRMAFGARQDAYGHTQEQVCKRIQLACRKQGVAALYMAFDFALRTEEKECLERMAQKLAGWGIAVKMAPGISTDTSGWDEMAESGNVLMILKAGLTTHRMVDEAMGFYGENGIHVVGAAVFLQHG